MSTFIFMYTIYTDGAYSSTRNQGGIGIVVLRDENLILTHSKMFKNTTNNQMELMAVIIGLRCISKSIDALTIVTDSQYVLGCATKGWKRKKNRALWALFDKEFDILKTKCQNITWKWTHGHADSKWNNLCDELAVSASHEV